MRTCATDKSHFPPLYQQAQGLGVFYAAQRLKTIQSTKKLGRLLTKMQGNKKIFNNPIMGK
jgi:hypothetical protein